MGYVHRRVDMWSVRLVHLGAGRFEWRLHNFGLHRMVGKSGLMAPKDASCPPEHEEAYHQGEDCYVARTAEDVYKLGWLLLKSLVENYKCKWNELTIVHEEV